ncbi:MAG: helix-turn-helix domain-containing protein [Clostridia bacterium]|nr:helix-turn-helix domain-containing protein [Clostridia bacterium]
MSDQEREIIPFLGERLKDIRSACSLTQDTLAEATGIDRSTLAYYESGRVYPSFNRMRRIASMLCISLDMLLGREYGLQDLWDSGPANVDAFFGTTPSDESTPAYNPLPLPANLGALSTEEQLLVLYYRQLEQSDKLQFITDMSSTVERTQRELYGLDDDDADIILDNSNPFEE